jgi:hypothetical protein
MSRESPTAFNNRAQKVRFRTEENLTQLEASPKEITKVVVQRSRAAT